MVLSAALGLWAGENWDGNDDPQMVSQIELL